MAGVGDRLLSQWTVRDALSVLDEIDHSLAVIVAIEKLAGDETADELHILHPLVTQARWLFGPEFDSSEYSSNVSLRTAAEKIFKKRLSTDAFINAKQRPDIMALSDSTCSIVGTEGFDAADPTLTRIQNVLIIELKKGRSAIGHDAETGGHLGPKYTLSYLRALKGALGHGFCTFWALDCAARSS